MKVPTNEILPVFFRAMVQGYAAGAPKTIHAEFPWLKSIEHVEDDFKVADEYYTTPLSSFSFGTTVIMFKDVPVWAMQYQGEYKKEVIPFLKQTLLETYQASKFVGGRGRPATQKDAKKHLIYTNLVEDGNWRNFSGRESIRSFGKKGFELLGWHTYSGLLLV